MEHGQEESKAEVKSSSSWGWVIPAIIGLILAKTLGLVGALVTIGSYFWLKPKIGILGSVILSAVFGIASGVVVSMLILN